MVETNETLLERVRRTDAHDAWREFYDAYRGPVLGYAFRQGLRGQAVDDILQDTFVTLFRVLPRFRYDRSRGRFRHFLLRIVYNRSQAARKSGRINGARHALLEECAAAEEVLDDVPRRLAEEEWMRAQHDWRAALVAEARTRVRRHSATKPGTMDIFDDFVIHSLTAEEVAAKHGTTVGNVHQIRHRTLSRIKRDLEQLLADAGEEPA